MANTPIQNIFPNAAQVDVLNAALQQIAGKIGVAATIQIVRVDTLPSGESATITEAPGSTESARQYILGIPAGQDGDTGAAAGFGTIQATVTELASGQQPTVEAQLSGPDTAKNITFTFGIPKGKDGNPGDPGAAAGFGTISAAATKLPAGSDPTAEVSATGPDTAKNFAFTFGLPEFSGSGLDGTLTVDYEKTEYDELDLPEPVYDGYYDFTGTLYPSGSYGHIDIALSDYGISPNDSVYVSGYAKQNAMLYLFFNSDNEFISSYPTANVGPSVVKYENVEAKVPENAAKMIVGVIGISATYQVSVRKQAGTVKAKLVDGSKIFLPGITGEKIFSFGDSLMYGNLDGVGMLDSLVETYMCDYEKYAVNGATIVDGVNSISSQITKANGADPKFVIFDGGTNDAYDSTSLGAVTEKNVLTGFDSKTFAGAFEHTIELLRNKFPEAKLIYVSAHPMPTRNVGIQNQIHTIAIEACEKWNVDCVDMYISGGINTHLAYYRTKYSYGDSLGIETGGNGTHLNSAGYKKYYKPKILSRMKDLAF